MVSTIAGTGEAGFRDGPARKSPTELAARDSAQGPHNSIRRFQQPRGAERPCSHSEVAAQPHLIRPLALRSSSQRTAGIWAASRTRRTGRGPRPISTRREHWKVGKFLIPSNADYCRDLKTLTAAKWRQALRSECKSSNSIDFSAIRALTPASIPSFISWPALHPSRPFFCPPPGPGLGRAVDHLPQWVFGAGSLNSGLDPDIYIGRMLRSPFPGPQFG